MLGKSWLTLLAIALLAFLSTSFAREGAIDTEVSSAGDVDLTFDSNEKLNAHMKKLNDEAKAKAKAKKPFSSSPNKKIVLEDEELTEKKKTGLHHDELRARLKLEDVRDTFGKVSTEYVEALYKLGRALYKQEKFEEGLIVAKDIVAIHEKLDGVEHIKTAQALTNVASAAFRIGDSRSCELAMNRAIYIFIKEHGDNSKEVLLQRGRMLTFQVPHARTTGGMSYEDYTDEL